MYPRLKSFRESLGLTQEEFGKSLGIAKSTYNNYETGIRDPKSNFWIAVAQKYQVTIDYLMGFSDNPTKRKSSPYSSEACKLAEDYDKKLDSWGKKTVRAVTDSEIARCQAESAKPVPEPDGGKILRFRVPEYMRGMSAGTGQEAVLEFPQDLELTKAPPRGTSYIAHVSGDSMEPSYHNGDLVFVHSCEKIPVGRVGVFFMDGQQWVKELEDGVLISHNPAYPPRPMTEDVRCQGLVLGVCDESYFE